MTVAFDRELFLRELELERGRRDMSWRQVALECGLAPTTLQGVLDGAMPDLARFAALVDWMGASADTFIVRANPLVVFTESTHLLVSHVPVQVGKRLETPMKRGEFERAVSAIYQVMADSAELDKKPAS